MAISQRLFYRDIREVTELVGEVSDLGADPHAWRAHALSGLIRLTGGNVAITTDLQIRPGASSPEAIDPVDTGWASEKTRRVFLEYCQTEVGDDPGIRALAVAHQRGRFVSFTRRQAVDDGTWYKARAVCEMRHAADVDDFICSSAIIGPGMFQGFIIYRPWNARPFEERQRRMVRLFHAHVLRMYQQSAGGYAARQDPLPPRPAQVLELLFTGLSMKQIAARMGISPHTVNDYTKWLHSHFNVSTRAELLHTWQATRRRQSILRLPIRQQVDTRCS